jgi:hypothetical protein
MTPLQQIEAIFARELSSALGERGHGRLEIGRVVLDAPQAELARPGALRELAQATARELRARVWKE